MKKEVEEAKVKVLAVYPDAWHSGGVIWKFKYPSLHAISYDCRFPEEEAWLYAASKITDHIVDAHEMVQPQPLTEGKLDHE